MLNIDQRKSDREERERARETTLKTTQTFGKSGTSEAKEERERVETIINWILANMVKTIRSTRAISNLYLSDRRKVTYTMNSKT